MKKILVTIIPNKDNIIYDQRETGITHSGFSLEYILYRGIQAGDVATVNEAIDEYLNQGFVVGRLSDDYLTQVRYWAISCIAVAIHYAILGGMDETDAFNLSDIYIRKVGEFTSMEECVSYLRTKACELAEAVNDSKVLKYDSKVIQDCIHYINVHLHERLKVDTIANHLGFSKDYLGALFKKTTGITIHKFILQRKLEASKLLLIKGTPFNEICFSLGFCSESHFIECFKKEYGITPGKYKESTCR